MHCVNLLIFVTVFLQILSVVACETFIIDSDLVDELTEKRVHIELYDEFIRQYDRKPTQAEYESLLRRYQDKLRDTGIHPRIKDIVAGDKSEIGSVGIVFIVLASLLGFALLTTVIVITYGLITHKGY